MADLISVTALIGLVTLTFDLSISKRGHESPLSRASFLSNLSFLGSGTEQTDEQTDRQRSSMHYAHLLGGVTVVHINVANTADAAACIYTTVTKLQNTKSENYI